MQNLLLKRLEQSTGEEVIAYLCLYLIPGIILFVFVYFIVAILLPIYRSLRKKRRKYPTVAQDLRLRIRWWFQKVCSLSMNILYHNTCMQHSTVLMQFV